MKWVGSIRQAVPIVTEAERRPPAAEDIHAHDWYCGLCGSHGQYPNGMQRMEHTCPKATTWLVPDYVPQAEG